MRISPSFPYWIEKDIRSSHALGESSISCRQCAATTAPYLELCSQCGGQVRDAHAALGQAGVHGDEHAAGPRLLQHADHLVAPRRRLQDGHHPARRAQVRPLHQPAKHPRNHPILHALEPAQAQHVSGQACTLEDLPSRQPL